MKNVVNIIKKLFLYTPPKPSYKFALPGDSTNKITSNSSSDLQLPNEIVTSLDTNLTNLKVRYNALINSDIILREFSLSINVNFIKL